MSTQFLPDPNQRHLFSAGLETLHHESQEWLSDIEFWRDEVTFFHRLLERLDIPGIPVEGRSELMHMEKELIRISCEELNELQKKVRDHECHLSRLIGGWDRQNEQRYRIMHARIAEHVMDFDCRFSELKRYAFHLVKRMRPFAA